MTSRKQTLKKFARILILLLLTGAVGFLAGVSDDNDDNFGIASLEPGVVHSLAEKSSIKKSGTAGTAAAPSKRELAHSLSAHQHFVQTIIPSVSPTLVVPLRT